jgi:hypothetical protein
MNNTILKLATDLEDILGNMKYHHQDSGISKTVFMLVLLDHDSMTSERDPSILYNLSRESADALHYFEVGHRPRGGVRKHEIAPPRQWHAIHRIYVGPLGSWLKEK